MTIDEKMQEAFDGLSEENQALLIEFTARQFQLAVDQVIDAIDAKQRLVMPAPKFHESRREKDVRESLRVGFNGGIQDAVLILRIFRESLTEPEPTEPKSKVVDINSGGG